MSVAQSGFWLIPVQEKEAAAADAAKRKDLTAQERLEEAKKALQAQTVRARRSDTSRFSRFSAPITDPACLHILLLIACFVWRAQAVFFRVSLLLLMHLVLRLLLRSLQSCL